jgi:hypothetical protein
MRLVMMRENYCRLSGFVKESVERGVSGAEVTGIILE